MRNGRASGACGRHDLTALRGPAHRDKPLGVTQSPASAARGPVAARYDALVDSGAIERDPAQTDLVARLDELIRDLAEAPPAEKPGLLGRLFGRQPEPVAGPRGLYVWGLVGRGKTMLMDLFHEAAPGPKRRVHFHAFMGDVHDRIHRHRQAVKQGTAKGDDPIPPVAEALAAEATLLCFDEFTVTDIADAMILGRLFNHLFRRGVTVVATSNVEPDRLYEGGLNRALFLPFVATLKERVDVVRLDSRTDFRLEKLGGAAVYHVPADAAARAALDAAFKALTGKARGLPTTVTVHGRAVAVPEQATGVARFGFDDDAMLKLGQRRVGNIAISLRTEIAKLQRRCDGVGQAELRLDRIAWRADAAILHGLRIDPERDRANPVQRERRIAAQAQCGLDAVVRVAYGGERLETGIHHAVALVAGLGQSISVQPAGHNDIPARDTFENFLRARQSARREFSRIQLNPN